MTPEKCPGCGTKLQPEMLACPNCPMSFPEDDGPSGSVNPLKQSRYWNFVLPVLFFGIIGAAVWYLGIGLLHLGTANSQIENGNLFGDKPSAAAAASAGGASASSPGAQDAAPASPGGAASGTGSTDAKPDDDGGMIVISRADDNGGVQAAAPRPRPPKDWRLRGTIYDLTTLKPLAGCAMLFTDQSTNRSIKTRTDSTGRYRTIVPPLGDGAGYSVTIEKHGYAPNYLDPGTEGVPRMSASARRGMARDLAETLTAEPATVESADEKPVVTDFYLAPRP